MRGYKGKVPRRGGLARKWGWYITQDNKPFVHYWKHGFGWMSSRVAARAYRTKQEADSEAMLMATRSLSAGQVPRMKVVRFKMVAPHRYADEPKGPGS